jgi:thiazole/oxazole-forming peptide maturase SagD family component
MNPIKLSFGRALLLPDAQLLRQRLLELAAGTLEARLHSDSLLGMHFGTKLYPPDCDRFLLFDFHRIILYQNSLSSNGPRIDSVVQLIVDDYPIRLRSASAGEKFPFLYSVQVLDVLPFFWNRSDPGTVLVFDLVTAEIRASKACVHPSHLNPQIETSADCLPRDEAISPLTHRLVTAKLRSDTMPDFDGLVSPETGVIRRERIGVNGGSIPCSVSQVGGGAGMPLFCTGRDINPAAALLIGRCEALERYQVNFLNPQARLVYGSFDKLRDLAIDPQELCYARLRSSPTDDRVPYESALPVYWTSAQDLYSGKTFLVPAQEIWFDTARLAGEHICVHTSTNGCALGSSIEEAALFALLETIERDAFLTTWYLRRPCKRIIPESISLEVFQWLWHRIQSRYQNYKTYLFDISSEVAIPAVLCVAVKESGEGHHLIAATACRLNSENALLTAVADVGEALAPVSFDEKLSRKFLEHPERVIEPVDHTTLYSMKETIDRLAFLNFDGAPELTAADLNHRSHIPVQPEYNLRSVLEEIVHYLHGLQVRVLLKDITHTEFRGRSLFCVKAITPGLYPMWFGFDYIRFALTHRLQSLFQQHWGVPLLHHGQVNLELHPLG